MRRKHDAPQVAQVKNVAIVGFEVVQPVPVDVLKVLLTPNKKSEEPGEFMGNVNWSGMRAIPSAHARNIYDDSQKSLKPLTRWDILPTDAMTKHAAYKALFAEWMGAVQSRTPTQQGESKFHAPEILDYDSIQRMGASARDAMMNALKVDGIVAIKIQTVLHSATIMGIGSRYPQAVVQFQLYKKGVSDAIWYDVNAEGKKSDKSMGVTMLTADFVKMNQLIAESARSAYRQLVENTKKAP
jgi:hypothetical protein